MKNVHISFLRELNDATQQQRAAVTPVIISSLNNAGTLSKLPDATKHFELIADDFEYEVFCPNCARGEIASPHDMIKHLCNCGYGVFVEMSRTSPN